MPKVKSPGFFSFSNVSRQTARNAWDLFILSAGFAVLFNTFYPYGIDLKARPPQTTRLQGTQRNGQAPTTYAGWKKNGGSAKKTPAITGDISHLSLMGAKDRFDSKSAVFLDARNTEEYGKGHIPGALNFSALEMDKFAPLVMPQITDKNREIVVYCNGGDCTLSMELARMLAEQGYTRVAVFESGWPAWKKAGYPTNLGDKP